MRYGERVGVLLVCIVGIYWSMSIPDLKISAWAFFFCSAISLIIYVMMRRLDLMARRIEAQGADIAGLQQTLIRLQAPSAVDAAGTTTD